MPKALRPLLLCTLLAACGSPTASGDDPPNGSLVLYETAKDDAELFWDDLYRLKGLDYRPIAGFTPYSAQISVPCGETQLWDALYCQTNEKVYFHRDLLDEVLDVAGEAAVAILIAHEIGHHVSDLNGMYVAFERRVVRLKELELQADCHAGATAADGMLLDGRDAEQAVRDLMALVGRTGLRWFNVAIHGTADQRVRAFLLGLDGGNTACQEILQFRGF